MRINYSYTIIPKGNNQKMYIIIYEQIIFIFSNFTFYKRIMLKLFFIYFAFIFYLFLSLFNLYIQCILYLYKIFMGSK